MFKKMLFAAALTGLLAGAAIPVQPSTAEAASGCLKAAKAKFPGDHKTRVAYRKECKAHWKAYRTAQRATKKAA
ncbi:MAG: hypothetical protein ACXWJ4_06075 [Methyloceanibacter sp.]|jgi:hypothetical protein